MICTTVPAGVGVAGARLSPAVTIARLSVVVCVVQHFTAKVVVVGVAVELQMNAWLAVGLIGIVAITGAEGSGLTQVPQ